MKRLLIVFLVLSIFISVPTSIKADPFDDNEIIHEMTENIRDVENTAKSVKAIADTAEAASSFKNAFDIFTKGLSVSSSLLATVNGSVTFLRLVGVMKDPNTQALNNISNQLTIVNERLTEMDKKLNNITDQMTKMEAMNEFRTRSQNAQTLTKSWEDFITNYCENNLDKLMSDYQGMIYNGITAWCKNIKEDARTEGGVDNTSITILYKKTSNGYELSFSSENGVPKDFTKDDRYVIISANALADKIDWNVNTYQDDIKKVMLDALSRLLIEDNKDITVYNYDELLQQLNNKNKEMCLNRLAEDAVSTLMYRIASTQVNKDATYTRQVVRTWLNYYVKLINPNNGIDAILKAYYYTHAFQSEVVDDVTELCNSLIVKNAVYGMFVINILGASETATDLEKKQVMGYFNDSMTRLRQARNNALTSDDRYCYITGSLLHYAYVRVAATSSIQVYRHYDGFSYIKTLQECTSSDITLTGTHGDARDNLLNGVSLQVIKLTAESNGNKFDFDYLEKRLKISSGMPDYHMIVTSFDTETPFSFDGTVNMKVNNLWGDYFSNSSTISTMPSDASYDYLVNRRKITGNVLNLDTGEYRSNQVLLATASYAEDHWHWITCEAAHMAYIYNPYHSTYNVSEWISEIPNSYDSTIRLYQSDVVAYYNTIHIENYVNNSLNADSEAYDPVASYNETLGTVIEVEEPQMIEISVEAPVEEKTNNNVILMAVGAIGVIAIAAAVLRKKQEN